jgi:hypothetical protein
LRKSGDAVAPAENVVFPSGGKALLFEINNAMSWWTSGALAGKQSAGIHAAAAIFEKGDGVEEKILAEAMAPAYSFFKRSRASWPMFAPVRAMWRRPDLAGTKDSNSARPS